MKKTILKIFICIIIAFLIVLVIETFFIQPVRTEKISMFPTIKPNEVLLVNKWYGVTNKAPERGDIIMFKSPSKDYVTEEEYNPKNVLADYSEKNRTNLIKRVIGLPGEHIQISEDEKVYINGKLATEDYLQSSPSQTASYGMTFSYCDVIVPENSVYVLGDYPYESADSRSFGCIPMDKIEGKVWIRIYPFSSFGKLEYDLTYWTEI